MMPSTMRTTLTIDDDIARALKELSRERGSSFKAVVNDVLRQGLTTGEKPPTAREPFSVQSAPRGFRPGIDPLKLNQLADELETEDFLSRNHGS
jgi:hypothetical protein